MRVTQAARRPGRSLQDRRSAIDGELGFAIEDHEHLFTSIVKVSANSALWFDDAAMEELQIGLYGMGVAEREWMSGRHVGRKAKE